jgi:hypothetical protein
MVEMKVYFSVFAKLRKSCENEQIYEKCHEISLRENLNTIELYCQASAVLLVGLQCIVLQTYDDGALLPHKCCVPCGFTVHYEAI